MRRSVTKGRVIEETKYSVEINGERYYVPAGCDPKLDVIAGQEVEVLFAGNEILALRIDKDLATELKIPPIFTCYLMPPWIVFDQSILQKIQPLLTKTLVESNVLDADTAKQLETWHKESGIPK